MQKFSLLKCITGLGKKRKQIIVVLRKDCTENSTVGKLMAKLSVNSINCSIYIRLASIKIWITPATQETTGNLHKGRETPPANKQLTSQQNKTDAKINFGT